jgi:hypothetical protein
MFIKIINLKQDKVFSSYTFLSYDEQYFLNPLVEVMQQFLVLWHVRKELEAFNNGIQEVVLQTLMVRKLVKCLHCYKDTMYS